MAPTSVNFPIWFNVEKNKNFSGALILFIHIMLERHPYKRVGIVLNGGLSFGGFFPPFKFNKLSCFHKQFVKVFFICKCLCQMQM